MQDMMRKAGKQLRPVSPGGKTGRNFTLALSKRTWKIDQNQFR